jgi:hypothetical protein
MPVIPLTVVTGLCLVFTFIVFFLCQHTRGRVSSVERDSLLPFAEEGRRAPGSEGGSPSRPADACVLTQGARDTRPHPGRRQV